MTDRTEVAIVGAGQLADMTADVLGASHPVSRPADLQAGAAAGAALVLVLQDEWRPDALAAADEALRRAGVPWLGAFVCHDEGVVGPLVRPDRPGCSQCADARRLAAGQGRGNLLQAQMQLLLHGFVPPGPAVTGLGLRQMSRLIAAEADRALRGEPCRTEGRLYLVDLHALAVSLHTFLPDPLCPVCGRMPDDSAEAARIALRPTPKASPEAYRSRPADDLAGALVRNYLDERTGLLNAEIADIRSPFAHVVLNLPAFYGNEPVSGRSDSYARSRTTGILEGLERYCGMMPRGKRTVVRDSYRNLSDCALDPVLTGTYAPEQYAQPDFPMKPFDPERPIRWVWGYSFARERPILVPKSLAYYTLGAEDGFVEEGSSGCALGASLEEAVLHGILEAAERDAVLLAWYARLPLPELDPGSAGDTELTLMIERLRAAEGFDVRLFNAATDNGIPAIWAAARNLGGTGPRLVCASGAHLEPARAAKSAVYELSGFIAYLGAQLEENKEACARMLDDASLVERMEDHALLYGLPEAEERLRFLLGSDRPLVAFGEAFPPRQARTDLTEDLRELIGRFLELGLDVIVVDQTAPEIAQSGLYCVKVLIPGLLPMSFGHGRVRLTGLGRVRTLPMKLGYCDAPLAPDQLNPYPHPFM